MWGSFNEIAKKAQELQEQVTHGATSVSLSSPVSLFNLDAMQHVGHRATAAAAAQKSPPPEVQAVRPVKPILSTPAAGSNSSMLEFFHTPVPNNKQPPAGAKGKLQVNVSRSPPPVLATAAAPTPTPPSLQPSTVGGTAPTSPVAIHPAEQQQQQQLQHVAITTNETDNKDDESPPVSQEDDGNLAVDPNHSKADPVMVVGVEHEENPNISLVLDPAIECSGDTAALLEKSHDHALECNGVPNDHVDGNTTTSTNAIEFKSLDTSDNVEDTPVDSEHEVPTDASQLEQQEEQQPEHVPAQQQQQHPKQSLIVLTSSIGRKSVQLTERIVHILKVHQIPYETVEATDPTQTVIRDHLLQANTGTENANKEYPLLFLVQLSDGMPTFWGTYERLEQANDDGILLQELFASRNGQRSVLQESTSQDRDTEQQHLQAAELHQEQSLEEEATADKMPDEKMLELFAEQLKRVEENHQNEMQEMERWHAQQLEQLKTTTHEPCLRAARELEKQLMAQLREKEDQMREIMRANEGYQLKMDALQREVQGTQALLEERDTDLEKVNDENVRKIKVLEKKLQIANENAEKSRHEEKAAKETLESTQKELAGTKAEHIELKARVKTVAGELKDRRIECRDLAAKVEELTEVKRNLKTHVENLEYQLLDQRKSGSERHDEIEQLRTQLTTTQTEVESLKKALLEKDAKNEKLLADYKKKAQGALALANSRTAAAVQAKEEAEMETRAARSTADTAMERAMKAEFDAKAGLKEMESERALALEQLKEAQATLAANEAKLQQIQAALTKTSVAEQQAVTQLEKVLSDLAAERSKSLALEKELADARVRLSVLHDDVSSLRDQVRRAEAAARQKPDTSAVEEEKKKQSIVQSTVVGNSTDHESVVILQQELQQANQTIQDLKEALTNAVEQYEALNNKVDTTGATSPDQYEETNGGGPAPLFYAMEKQAALNTARSEINRLANLLSDAQSEKMEAMEAAEEMRKKKEEAEARLQRYEKLRPSAEAKDQALRGMDRTDSGAVNIEYLKNIMMRYLNAKTLAERKALVPVIGAVLCLTPDEQRHALASVEESSSFGGVGTSIFETFSGKFSSK